MGWVGPRRGWVVTRSCVSLGASSLAWPRRSVQVLCMVLFSVDRLAGEGPGEG